MVQYADECRALDNPVIFDSRPAVRRMEGDQLRDGITGATIGSSSTTTSWSIAAAEDRDDASRTSWSSPRR